jgi:CDP-diacylglycerol--serine O-phosphatidyltransferase
MPDKMPGQTPVQEPKKLFRPSLVSGSNKVRAKLQGKAFLVPSLVTVAAFFCGFLAVIESLRGDYLYATKCIALAAIFDGLDGRVARRLNAMTAFGREFDSLSDLVSFGVAPAIMVYAWAFQSSAQDFGAIAAFTYAVCAAARLARFNLDTGGVPTKHFTGLPSPGAAMALIPLVYFSPEAVTSPVYRGFLSIYLLLLGFLMVCELPYFSLKHLKFTHENSRRTILVIAIMVAVAWYSNQLFFLLIGVSYGMSGAIAYLVKKFFPHLREALDKAGV